MGLYVYRATAECSACGKVVDIGPFEDLTHASACSHLPGWIFPFSLSLQMRDGMGTPFTICDDCMGRPIRDVVADIQTRHGTAT